MNQKKIRSWYHDALARRAARAERELERKGNAHRAELHALWKRSAQEMATELRHAAEDANAALTCHGVRLDPAPLTRARERLAAASAAMGQLETLAHLLDLEDQDLGS